MKAARFQTEKMLSRDSEMSGESMNQVSLYPLRFVPIYQYRLWGGRRLSQVLSAPLPEGPVGEAWLLSDREDHASLVANGPLEGRTIGELLENFPVQLLGKMAGHHRRFPLLLKFLDVRDTLSVQVHPSDQQTAYLPVGESGKTEAWVVMAADAESKIYAGLKQGTTPENLRRSLASGTVKEHLANFTPNTGDSLLIPAGTVHSLGDVVVFEVQENSDVTFRLFDWDHVDAKTGKPRPLQVEEAMACIDFAQEEVKPVVPVVEMSENGRRERLIHCEHFGLWRLSGESPFVVGAEGTPRVLVCIAGEGRLENEGENYDFSKGDVLLLPAAVGTCLCQPHRAVTLLEISLPEI
jgi:mannose-6-phosphate isomerase